MKREFYAIKKEISSHKVMMLLYLFVSILLAIPSIIYLCKNKTIYYFTRCFYLYTRKNKHHFW